MGLQRVGHDWATFTFTDTYTHDQSLRKCMETRHQVQGPAREAGAHRDFHYVLLCLFKMGSRFLLKWLVGVHEYSIHSPLHCLVSHKWNTSEDFRDRRCPWASWTPLLPPVPPSLGGSGRGPGWSLCCPLPSPHILSFLICNQGSENLN